MFQIAITSSIDCITPANTFLCAFENDLFKTVGKIRRINTGRDHFLLKMLDGNGNCGISVKRHSSRHHFIQSDTQR